MFVARQRRASTHRVGMRMAVYTKPCNGLSQSSLRVHTLFKMHVFNTLFSAMKSLYCPLKSVATTLNHVTMCMRTERPTAGKLMRLAFLGKVTGATRRHHGRHTLLRRLRRRARRPLHRAALASPPASPAGRPPAQPRLASAAPGTTTTGPGTRRGRATPPRPRRCTHRRSSSTATE